MNVRTRVLTIHYTHVSMANVVTQHISFNSVRLLENAMKMLAFVEWKINLRKRHDIDLKCIEKD